jgi:hypothetical protein
MVLDLGFLSLGAFLFGCVGTQPRTWWQELFSGAALHWAGTGLFFLAVILGRYRRRRSFVTLLAMLPYLALVGRFVVTIAPYLGPASKPVEGKSYAFLLFDGTGASSLEGLGTEVRRLNPDVVIVTGAEGMLDTVVAIDYPHAIHNREAAGRGVSVYSKYPWRGDPVTTLGPGALPGVAADLALDAGAHCWLGAINLASAYNDSDFQLNRVTARRMASFLLNKKGCRVMAGDLQGSQFSRIVSLFEQVKLKNVLTSVGVKRFVSDIGVTIFPDHIYHSREDCVAGVEIGQRLPNGHLPLLFKGVPWSE